MAAPLLTGYTYSEMIYAGRSVLTQSAQWLTVRLPRFVGGLWRRIVGNRQTAVGPREWVEVETGMPSPLLEMYREVLSQHGIPAVIFDSGVGRGAMGGAPGFGSLRVPADYAEVARALIGQERDDETPVAPPESERNEARGE